MPSPTITISGTAAIAKAFRELEPKLAKKVIRQAIRRGMKTIAEDAKARAPVLTGAGRDSIRVKASKGPRGSKRGTIALAVLVGEAKGPTWYMSLQEYGWTPGKRIRVGGKTVGHVGGHAVVPGKHFMQGAMRSNEASVTEQVIRDILDGVERQANGAAK